MDINTHGTLKNGLLGYWTLDAGAQDVSGNARHGTPEGIPSLVQGKLRTCYRLNGTSQAIDLTNNMALAPTTGLTVACWVKIEGAAARQWQVPICRFYYGWNVPVGESGLCYLLQFDRTAKTWSWVLGTGTSSAGVTVTNDTEGRWVFLVGTWNGTTIRLYLNGAEVGTPAAFAGPLNQESSLKTLIGSRMGDGFLPATRRFDYMNGLVDDVGIWNRALTTDEIADLYQGGIGITWNGTFNSIGAHPTLLNGLIAGYPLSNITDVGPNGFTLSPENSPLVIPGLYRNCYQLNGTNQDLIVSNSLVLAPAALSISMWVYIAGAAARQWQNVVSRMAYDTGNQHRGYGYWFSFDRTTKVCTFAVGNGTATAGSEYTRNIEGVWVHVVGTYDGVSIKQFQDAVQVGTVGSLTGAVNQEASLITILGARQGDKASPPYSPSTRNDFMNGKVDEVYFWNRALTLAEVRDLYHTGYPLRYAEVPATDLVAIAAHTISDFVGSATIPAGMDYERSSHPLARARDVADLSLTGGICLPQDPEIIYLENRLLPAGSVPIAATRSTHPAHPQNVGTASGIYVKRRS